MVLSVKHHLNVIGLERPYEAYYNSENILTKRTVKKKKDLNSELYTAIGS